MRMFNSTLLDTVRQKSGYPILIVYYPVLSRKSRSIPIVVAKKTGHHPPQEIATAPEFAGWHYPGCIMMQRMERMDIYIYMVAICVSYIVYYVMDIYVMYIYIIMWQLYVVVLEWRCAYTGRKKLSQPIEPFGSQMGMCCD
jgi:hypothetical protein